MMGGWFLGGIKQECYLAYCNQSIMVVLAAQLNKQAPILYLAGVMLEMNDHFRGNNKGIISYYTEERNSKLLVYFTKKTTQAG